MKEVKFLTIDPICGMAVDEATALHVSHTGHDFYFCSTLCLEIFSSNFESPPRSSTDPTMTEV